MAITETDVSTETGDVPVKNDHSIYDGIISDFEYRFRNQIGAMDGRGNACGYYDLNGDGQDELLLARGISPSQVQPIAIYNLGGEVEVGDRLYDYPFPEDADNETPQWNYINRLASYFFDKVQSNDIIISNFLCIRI